MNSNTKQTGYLPETLGLASIHPTANIVNSSIIGNVTIDEYVNVINAVIRADEGTPFYISKGSNIQDFVTFHAYFTQENGVDIESKLIDVKDKGKFAIFIGENVSVSHGVLVHGPVFIGNNTFVGFKSTVESCVIGQNVEIGAHTYIANVTIPDHIGIAPGAIITKQTDIEKYRVPSIGINPRIVDVNLQLVDYYKNNMPLT